MDTFQIFMIVMIILSVIAWLAGYHSGHCDGKEKAIEETIKNGYIKIKAENNGVKFERCYSLSVGTTRIKDKS